MRISDWSSDVCSSDLHFIMQMRTGTAAGCTDKPDLLAISYRLPCFDKNLFKVRIARADAMAVVDLDHAAERPSPAGMGDHARCCGIYLRLHCSAEVETAVGRLAAVERIGPGSEDVRSEETQY